MKYRIRRVFCVLGMAGAAASLVASELTIPHTFTSGTPAVAAQVNENFAATRTAVNDNDTRVTQLIAQVQVLSATVDSLQQQLADLEDAFAGSNIGMGLWNSSLAGMQQLRVRPGVAVMATAPQAGRVELQITGAD